MNSFDRFLAGLFVVCFVIGLLTVMDGLVQRLVDLLRSIGVG